MLSSGKTTPNILNHSLIIHSGKIYTTKNPTSTIDDNISISKPAIKSNQIHANTINVYGKQIRILIDRASRPSRFYRKISVNKIGFYDKQLFVKFHNSDLLFIVKIADKHLNHNVVQRFLFSLWLFPYKFSLWELWSFFSLLSPIRNEALCDSTRSINTAHYFQSVNLICDAQVYIYIYIFILELLLEGLFLETMKTSKT